jgi:uncharacterized phage-associated protein
MNGIPAIIQSLCYLLSQLDKADKLQLVKLMYLADKYHLMKYGRTVSGDDFYAFEHGPAGSKTINVLNFDKRELGSHLDTAKRLFKKGQGEYEFVPGEKCERVSLTMLSDTDMEALEFVLKTFGKMGKKVIDYSHKLPEWKKYKSLFVTKTTKREPIRTEEVLSRTGDRYFTIADDHIEESRKILTGTYD